MWWPEKRERLQSRAATELTQSSCSFYLPQWSSVDLFIYFLCWGSRGSAGAYFGSQRLKAGANRHAVTRPRGDKQPLHSHLRTTLSCQLASSARFGTVGGKLENQDRAHVHGESMQTHTEKSQVWHRTDHHLPVGLQRQPLCYGAALRLIPIRLIFFDPKLGNTLLQSEKKNTKIEISPNFPILDCPLLYDAANDKLLGS